MQIMMIWILLKKLKAVNSGLDHKKHMMQKYVVMQKWN